MRHSSDTVTSEQIYQRLILIRECEERIRKEYPSNELKTPVHLGIGAEAISVGVVSKLPASTSYFGTYRNHCLYLAAGGSLERFWAELYGKSTGCGKGKAGSMHLSDPQANVMLTSAVVGTTIPIAVGAALRNKYLGNDELVCVFFGDGACEEGVFHESLNFASLHRLRILFVCEDNDLAIHNHLHKRQAFELLDLVRAYQIQAVSIQGHLIDNVRAATAHLLKALKRGPAFLHAKYHRFLEHVGPNEDYAVGYRDKPKNVSYLDPLQHLDSSFCIGKLDREWRDATEEKIALEIDLAIAQAKEAPFPDDSELYKDVYETP